MCMKYYSNADTDMNVNGSTTGSYYLHHADDWFSIDIKYGSLLAGVMVL